jgi:hypothetical protein
MVKMLQAVVNWYYAWAYPPSDRSDSSGVDASACRTQDGGNTAALVPIWDRVDDLRQHRDDLPEQRDALAV